MAIEYKCELRRPDHATIVHISDLHFTGRTSGQKKMGPGTNWARLQATVAKLQPDVIVATGDLINSPSKRALRNVYQYLGDLCLAADLKMAHQLKVVPGNHDYRFLGLGFGYGRNWFQSQFTEQLKPVLFKFTAANRPPLDVAVCGLDSNTGGWFADGSVSSAELHRCEAILESVATAFSIVLMHHHPAPVLRGEGAADARIEPTMILRNAGRVVDTLLEKGADLVLHGHKHWHGLSHVMKPESQRHLAIVAAGSAGHEKAEFFRFNAIRVRRSHLATVELLEAQTGSDYVLGKKISVGRYDLSRQRRRERLILANAKHFPWKSARVESRCSVDNAGNALLYKAYRPLQQNEGNSRFLAVTAKSSIASAQTGEPKIESAKASTCTFEWAQDDGLWGFNVHGNLDDRRSCGPLAFTTSLTNAFAHTVEEKERALARRISQSSARRDVADEAKREWLDFHHKIVLADQLLIVLEFPPELEDLYTIERMHVHAYDYSAFSASNEFTLLDLLDADESEYSAKTFFQSKACQFTLYVDRPLPGYRYRIDWLLPTRSELSKASLQPHDSES